MTIEFKIVCQSELACPELVEGKTDERNFKTFVHFIVTLRQAQCDKIMIVTLRQAQCDRRFKTFCQPEFNRRLTKEYS